MTHLASFLSALHERPSRNHQPDGGICRGQYQSKLLWDPSSVVHAGMRLGQLGDDVDRPRPLVGRKLAQIKDLKAKVRRLEDDNDILRPRMNAPPRPTGASTGSIRQVSDTRLRI